MDLTSARTTTHDRRLLAGLVFCLALLALLALLWVAYAGAARAQAYGSTIAGPGGGSATTPVATAAVAQCVTASEPAERSATFSGEMTMIAGATRMSMRIELLERMLGETSYHTVIAPGLGVWRTADPSVKVYKYLKQVTDLAAPAAYRAEVSFRWQGPKGRPIKRLERRTPKCAQPAPPAPLPSPPLE